jgi:hypothetical protein
MAFIDDIPEPTDEELHIFEMWWVNHEHPGYRRIWANGVDVTDQDPATWPQYWRDPALYSRSRTGRSSRRG